MRSIDSALAAWLAVLVAGCSDPSTGVVGPFAGQRHRFVVDRIDVARDAGEAEAVAMIC